MRRRSSFLWRSFRVLEAGLVLISLILLVFVGLLAIETWWQPWRDPKHSLTLGDSSASIGKVQDQGTFEAGVMIVWRREAASASHTGQWAIGPAYLLCGCSGGHVAVFTTMPFWLAAVLGGLGPAYVVVRFLTRRRPRPCECQACGYDLTGNTSGVCPECGTPATEKNPTDKRPGTNP